MEQEYCVYSDSYKKYVESFKKGRSLNLGCSVWKFCDINIDHNKNVKPDMLHDLNSFPYPLPKESFDSIFMLDILEHLKSPRAVIHEALVSLKPNGVIFISAPNERSKYFRHSTHVNFYKENDWICMMETLKGICGERITYEILSYRGNTKNISSKLGLFLGEYIGNETIIIINKEKVK